MTNPNHQATGGGAAEEAAPGSLVRSVPEWRGATPDAAIPPRVKLRIWERCGGRCALTGRKIMPGDAFDYDHILALSCGGEHREKNLQLALRDAHREKTADDVRTKAKIARTALKFRGLWPKSKRPLKSRNTFQRRAPDTMGEKL